MECEGPAREYMLRRVLTRPFSTYRLRRILGAGMSSKNVRDEAESLIREHATNAYRIAAEQVLCARRSRSRRVEQFRTDVVEEVSRRLKRLEGHGTGKNAGRPPAAKDDDAAD